LGRNLSPFTWLLLVFGSLDFVQSSLCLAFWPKQSYGSQKPVAQKIMLVVACLSTKIGQGRVSYSLVLGKNRDLVVGLQSAAPTLFISFNLSRKIILLSAWHGYCLSDI
jgi:hypothetical protein